MPRIPEYCDTYLNLFSVELTTSCISIENSFELLEYDAHQDDIAAVYDNPIYADNKDISLAIIALYKLHINSVLEVQGILLANPESNPLPDVAKILYTVTALATADDINDILSGMNPITDDTPLIYLASIIADMIDMQIAEVLALIESVTPDILKVLNTAPEFEPPHSNMTDVAEIRFKKALATTHTIIVVDTIRQLGYFGYNLNSILSTVHDAILELPDIEEQANELIMLVLGSSTPDTIILATILHITDLVYLDPLVRMRVNAIITKQMSHYND